MVVGESAEPTPPGAGPRLLDILRPVGRGCGPWGEFRRGGRYRSGCAHAIASLRSAMHSHGAEPMIRLLRTLMRSPRSTRRWQRVTDALSGSGTRAFH